MKKLVLFVMLIIGVSACSKGTDSPKEEVDSVVVTVDSLVSKPDSVVVVADTLVSE